MGPRREIYSILGSFTVKKWLRSLYSRKKRRRRKKEDGCGRLACCRGTGRLMLAATLSRQYLPHTLSRPHLPHTFNLLRLSRLSHGLPSSSSGPDPGRVAAFKEYWPRD